MTDCKSFCNGLSGPYPRFIRCLSSRIISEVTVTLAAVNLIMPVIMIIGIASQGLPCQNEIDPAGRNCYLRMALNQRIMNRMPADKRPGPRPQ